MKIQNLNQLYNAQTLCHILLLVEGLDEYKTNKDYSAIKPNNSSFIATFLLLLL